MSNVFIVSKISSFWGVIHYGVILSRCSTSTEALQAAIRTAARAAQTSEPAQVLMENSNGARAVVWDSRHDGFTEA